VSPSGLFLVGVLDPVAYATGKYVSPSGLCMVGLLDPVAYATGKYVSPSGLRSLREMRTAPHVLVAYATGKHVSPSGVRRGMSWARENLEGIFGGSGLNQSAGPNASLCDLWAL